MRLTTSITRQNAARTLPPAGLHIPLAYAQWLIMMAAGLLLGSLISRAFTAVCAGLWVMGCIYNIPPVRTKEIAYLDVLTESINNPLRMLMGWYMITDTIVPRFRS